MNNDERLIKTLNDMWGTLSVKPKYTEFNTLFPCDGSKLELIEKENDKIGLSDFKSFKEQRAEHGDDYKWVTKGFSLLSLLSTITDELCGKRLAARVEDDETISGWQFIPPQGDQT